MLFGSSSCYKRGSRSSEHANREQASCEHVVQQTQICLAYEHVDVALSLVRARRPAATESAAVERAIDEQVGQNRVLRTLATDGRGALGKKRLWGRL